MAKSVREPENPLKEIVGEEFYRDVIASSPYFMKCLADGDPISVVMEVTPNLAGDWLARNMVNRRMAETSVARYSRDIREDAWKLTGETVKFDIEGELLDGQHRLAAIVQEDLPVKMMVTFGLEPDVASQLDSGRKRSFADMLRMEGESNHIQYAATVNMLMKYEKGKMHRGHEATPTINEAWHYYKANPEIRQDINTVANSCKILGHITPLIVAHKLFRDISEADPESNNDYIQFFHRLARGLNLTEDDPIWRLRQKLLADKKAKLRMPSEEVLAITIKAWNFWKVGRPISQLSWRGRGDGSETFPVPQ